MGGYLDKLINDLFRRGKVNARMVSTQAPGGLASPSMGVGVYATPVVDTSLADNIAFISTMRTATNKTVEDTSSMAAYIGIKNTAHTANNKMQGLLVANNLGFNCFDAYAVQGHTTIGAGGVSTKNVNAHITGLSGKVKLTGAVGKGWVTGVLGIIEGAGAVTGLCHAIAAQVEADVGDDVVDSVLFLGADAAVPAAIEVVDSAKIAKLLKISAASGVIDAHSAGAAASGKQILIDIGGSPYALAVCAVGTE